MTQPILEPIFVHTPLVSIVVLNWNGEMLLGECLESLSRTSYPCIEVIVVDNGSTDGSAAIAELHPEVKWIAAGKNLGYTEGNAVGIAQSRGKYLVTLNNDMTVDPAWITEAVRYLEQDDAVGIVGCRQMSYSDSSIVDSLYLVPTRHLLPGRMAHALRFNPSDPLHASTGVVLGANGGSAIYRRSCFDELGGFEAKFFAYHEECDLAMRAFAAGWKCLYVPTAVVFHKGSASFGKVKKSFFYYHERNRIWFIYRNFGWTTVATNFFILAARELRTATNILARGYALTYIRARVEGVLGCSQFRAVRQKQTRLLGLRTQDYRALLHGRKLPYTPPVAQR